MDNTTKKYFATPRFKSIIWNLKPFVYEGAQVLLQGSGKMKRQTDKLLLFGILAVAMIYVWALGSRMKTPAIAEATPQEGSGGQVLIVPIQIDRDNYGLAMVDTNRQSLWIYELNRRAAAHNRLRLLAARSWKYDKLLEDYNTAEPKPNQIKALLEKLGSGSFEATLNRQQNRQDKEYEDLISEGVSEKTEPRQGE